jgi:asparagine N-glycosylation enzyme membrane subunit Stt3
MSTPLRKRPIGPEWAGVAICILVAFCVRSLGVAEVFPGGDEVVLAIWDGSYHARRALFSFVNFPAVLFFDPYLSHPGGAPVPMPPLYDWLLAAVARATGASQAHFECVAAWASPVLAALSVVPVFLAARLCGGRGVGLGAAALFALLPATALSSGVGDPDHHAAVALLGATALTASLALVAGPTRSRAGVALTVALGALRAAIALSWSGSLLLLGLLDAGLALAAVVGGRTDLFRSQSAGALLAALLVAPWVAAAPTPIGGALSSTTLSWLHVGALVAVGVVAAIMAGLEQRAPAGGAWQRGLRLAAVVALGAGALAALPAVREALAPALAFVAKGDAWAPRNAEQAPLFHGLGGPTARRDLALRLFGGFAYLIPAIPIYALWRARQPELRASMVVLAVWSAVLGGLAILQIRFGNDFAPAACVGFALLLDGLRAGVARRLPARAASGLAIGTGIALLAPAVAASHLPRVPAAWAFFTGHPSPTPSGRVSAARFARTLRRATPETSGYFNPAEKPEYGVLVKPSLGHVTVYVAHRPTPTTGFGPYLDPARYEKALRFYRSRNEAEALEIAEALDVRYVVTFDHRALRSAPFPFLLHRDDGSRETGESSGRFRLIAEGPAGGRPLWAAFPRGAPASVTPYKLFEIVEGATLVAMAPPGTPVRAELELTTDVGRDFRYRAARRADITGVARIRVPYPTGTHGAGSEWTHATGPYLVRVGGSTSRVDVTEDDVRRGAAIRVD